MKIFLIVFSFVIVISTKAQPLFQWAKGLGNTQNDAAFTVTADALGNVYHVGYFQGTVDFDPGPGTYTLTSLGLEDIYIAKYDMNGNFSWAERMGGTLTDIAQGIAIDPSGNIYVSGYFAGTSDLDPSVGIFSVTSAGGYDVFVTKTDQNGNFIWTKTMGGTGNDICNFLKIDASSNVYTTGSFSGIVDFDPGAGVSTFTSLGSTDIFINKLDANGNFILNKCFHGSGGDEANSIDVDASGNIYTTGYFFTTCDFDPGPGTFTYSSAGSYEIFISKLDASGNFVWAKKMGQAGAEVGYGINVDASGNVYSTGYFTGTVDFDPGAGTFTLTSAGGYDIYINKLDASGNFLWTTKMGSTGNDAGSHIKIGPAGNIYSTGYFNGSVDFDPGVGTFSLTSVGANDMYLSQLDASGNFVWAMSMGGGSNDYGASIFPDQLGNIYVAGYYTGSPDFDPGAGTTTLTSNGGYDAYLLKLSFCSAPASPTNITTPGNQTVCSNNLASLTATAQGTVLWYSTPTSTIVLGSGNTFTAPPLTAGNYTFFAQTYSCITSATRTPVTLTVIPGVTVSAASNEGTICVGQSATLTASGSASSYSWSSGGTGTLEIVSPTITTTYTLTGTIPNGCVANFTLTQFVNPCTTGLKSFATTTNDLIKIYPNPTNGVLTIETANEETSTLTLSNLLGEIIITEIISGTTTIDLTTISSGIYLLRTEQNGKTQLAKIVKN